MDSRVLMIWILTSPAALSQTPWKEISTSKYELTFYSSRTLSFDNAKSICQNIGADLIQLDDFDVRNKFYETVSKISNPGYFWIGATGTMYDWIWLNGGRVDSHLITWQPGQPDNWLNKENKMLFYSNESYFVDVPSKNEYGIPICQRKRVVSSGISNFTFYRFNEGGNSYARNYDSAKSLCYSHQSRLADITDSNKATIINYINHRPADLYWTYGKTGLNCVARKGTGNISKLCIDTYYFICEQVQTNSIYLYPNFPEISLPSQTTMICAASGHPYPDVRWTKNNNAVSTSESNSVYQIQTTGRATLQLEKGKITDEDQYTCVATNSYGGSTFSQNKQLQVKVPSTPTINKVTANPCNSSLVIEWKPHHRAIERKHRFSFLESSSKTSSEIYMTPADDKIQYMTTGNLSSSTRYTITIEPCSDIENCYPYATSKTSTTGGIPNPVTNVVLNSIDEKCMVSWNMPKIIHPGYITRIEISVMSFIVQHSVGVNVTTHKYITFVSSSILSYAILTLPNRNYSVYMKAKTCAGVGRSTVATGTCVTELRAPTFLAQPQSISYITDNFTAEITIQTPDESNGRINCVFVLVQIIDVSTNRTKPVLNEQYLRRLSSVSLEDEYIAIAIDRQIIKSERTNLIIGDHSVTLCQLEIKNKSNRKNQAATEDCYVGMNKPLNKDLSYNVFMVTATLSETQIYFKTSNALTLRPHITTLTTITKENTAMLVSSLVAGVVFITLLVMVIVFMRRRHMSIISMESSSKNNSHEEHDPSRVYKYPSMKKGQPGIDNILNVPAKTIDESTYEHINDNLSSTCHENAVYENQENDNPYEMTSPYELISS